MLYRFLSALQLNRAQSRLLYYFAFREKKDAFKVRFSVNSLTRLNRTLNQVKVASPEESGRIVTHENLYFANGNYERRSSKLSDENAKC